MISVPQSAVRRDGNGTFVYVVEQNRLVRREVVTGITDPVSGRLEIVSGLRVGERVLAAPGEVQPNTPVRFEAPGSGTAAPKPADSPASPVARE